MLKMSGLKIVSKKKNIYYEINYKSIFSKEDKNFIKEYVNEVLQTDYREKCINVIKQENGFISFVGNKNNVICEIYLSEIKYLVK